jgi:hypothetical protein
VLKDILHALVVETAGIVLLMVLIADGVMLATVSRRQGLITLHTLVSAGL